MFRRFWDWMLGRKPPTPQPAPAPAAGVAQAAAPASPAAAPGSVPAVVPVPVGGARPAAAATPGGQPAAPGQDQDKQRRMAGGQTVAAAAGGAGGVSLAAALEQSFGKPTGQPGRGEMQGGNRPAAARSGTDAQTSKSEGYILHLTNGRRMPVPYYQEKGDQVVIEQVNGRYSLPKSIIARIEPRTAGTEVLSPGVNTR
jgi:hypothetical protein